MDFIVNSGVMVEMTRGDKVWSGSGFVLNGPSAFVVTSLSWMCGILDVMTDNHQSALPTVLSSIEINVYWMNSKQRIIQKSKANFRNIIYMKDVHHILKELENNSLNDWACDSTANIRNKDLYLYLSCVVILTLEDSLDLATSPIGFCNMKNAFLGEELFVVSTPYGSSYHKVFFNSVSSGCVSNKYGSEGQVIMTDARCVTGSEGGMVVMKDNQGALSVAGVVICSLADSDGIPIDATLICSISCILETIGHLDGSLGRDKLASRLLSIPPPVSGVPSTHLADLCDVIVPVKFGSLVGSGVILSANMVLTCAHVVRQTSSGIIRYRCIDIPAEVVFSTSKEEQHPDIAVLKVKQDLCYSLNVIDLEIYNYECSVSDPVLSLGYAYQNPFTNPTAPTFTRGVISKLLPPESPVMIQATSSVYQGMSGGLLCIARTLAPLGLLVCVARDEMTSFNHSKFSFVIPFSWIKSSLQEFITTRTTSVLSHFSGKNLWNFTEGKVYSKL